jgi:hypothetical protein
LPSERRGRGLEVKMDVVKVSFWGDTDEKQRRQDDKEKR